MGGFKQEMPPAGGYSPVNVFRKKISKPLNGIAVIASLWVTFFVGKYFFKKSKHVGDMREVESVESRVALVPFLLAEKQRLHLKQLIKNKEYEAELMSDIPGWEVGKWFDVPMYNNPRNLWIQPDYAEFYAHATSSNTSRGRNLKFQYK